MTFFEDWYPRKMLKVGHYVANNIKMRLTLHVTISKFSHQHGVGSSKIVDKLSEDHETLEILREKSQTFLGLA